MQVCSMHSWGPEGSGKVSGTFELGCCKDFSKSFPLQCKREQTSTPLLSAVQGLPVEILLRQQAFGGSRQMLWSSSQTEPEVVLRVEMNQRLELSDKV